MIARVTRKPRKKRIVILGGGFGGVYTAMQLEKLLARENAVEVCLVSRDNFFLFTPMLHEIAASDLEITNIVNPLRYPQQIGYDHLVLALGSVTNFHNLPGSAEFALPMKSVSDAIRLRAQVLRHMEEANSQCNLSDRESLLTFVVAGGGFAGVETVAALNDFVREALPFYPSVREEMLRVILVHSGPVILPELGEALGRYTQKVLTGRGVDIRLNTRVKGVTEENVSLVDGSSIPTRNLVWTAGTAPSPLIFSLPCMKAGGRLLVDQSLRVPDWPDVWAVGDCAFVPDMRNPGKSHPPTAQHAMREGKIVAQNIVAALVDRPLKSFSFRTIGLLASIGRRMGVARIFGFNFSGFFAWWMWRTIYLSKLPGLDKKIRVAFDWTLDLLFPKDVCAVYDLDDHGRNFRWLGQGKKTRRNKDDDQSAAGELVSWSRANGLTTNNPLGTEL